MPSISINHGFGFQLQESFAIQLEALIGASALEFAEQKMQSLEAEAHHDPQRWDGHNREWVQGGLQSALNNGTQVEWTAWQITTREGVLYRPNSRPSARPDAALLNDPQEANFEIRVKYTYADDFHGVVFNTFNGYCNATVSGPDESVRTLAAGVDALIRQHTNEESMPDSPFTVFVAYGGGRAWEVVRDYLEAAHIEVDAFVQSERASQVTIDVVSSMIHSASMAVIVMTAADQVDDAWQARQNVIHELGFAQGVLGLQRTLLLKEDVVTLPSNLAGLTYIEFARGEIHTTRERVLNLIRAARADLAAGI